MKAAFELVATDLWENIIKPHALRAVHSKPIPITNFDSILQEARRQGGVNAMNAGFIRHFENLAEDFTNIQIIPEESPAE